MEYEAETTALLFGRGMKTRRCEDVKQPRPKATGDVDYTGFAPIGSADCRLFAGVFGNENVCFIPMPF
jgi:hypothetical protein